MIRPNYTSFRRGSQFVVEIGRHLEHSAKGSTWEDHKYIKRIDGTYYYPDNYEGGRHLSTERKDGEEDPISKLEDMTGMKREYLIKLHALAKEKGFNSKEYLELLDDLSEGDNSQAKKISDILKGNNSDNLSDNDVENLAKEVIRGNFGNGQVRKDLLGEKYAEVQKRVNELMKGAAGQKEVSEVIPESVKKAEEAAKKADNSNVHSGVDMDRVQSVYRNKKSRR